MKISSITLLINDSHPDKLIMVTSLPSGMYPFTGNQTVIMDIASNQGLAYCEKHFKGVPLTIVNLTY